jgi:hypothetical protein
MKKARSFFLLLLLMTAAYVGGFWQGWRMPISRVNCCVGECACDKCKCCAACTPTVKPIPEPFLSMETAEFRIQWTEGKDRCIFSAIEKSTGEPLLMPYIE